MPVCERNKAGGQQLQLESYLGNPVPETRSALPPLRGHSDGGGPRSGSVGRVEILSLLGSLARVAATREASPRLDPLDCNRYARLLRGCSRVFDTA